MLTMGGVSARRKKIEVWECRCEQCGYEWTTQSADLPRRCSSPKCRSMLWNVTIQYPTGRHGRPPKAPPEEG